MPVHSRRYALCCLSEPLAIIGFLLLASTPCLAEDPPVAQWVARGGGALFDNGSAVAVDSSGNVYYAGTFQTNGTFGSTTFTAMDGGALFLAKLSPSGAFLWAKNIESGVTPIFPVRVQIDSAGKLLLMATPAGDGGLNPPLNQLLIGKFEPSTGSTIWTRKIKSTFFADTIGRGLAQDATGNIYVAGSFSGTTDFGAGFSRTTTGNLDAFLLKLSSAGTTLGVKTFGQTSGSAPYQAEGFYGVAVDNAGNVHVTGEFGSTMNLETGSIVSGGQLDIFVAKFDPSLNLLWARKHGSTGNDYGRALARDAAGNIYLFAYADGAYSLGINFPFSGPFVAKLDAAGSLIWGTPVGVGLNGTDGAYGFLADSANNLLLSSGGTLVKLNNQGTPLWARLAFSDWTQDLAVQNLTNIFVASTANGVFTLDSLRITNQYDDAIVAKFVIPPTTGVAITLQPTNQSVAVGGNVTFYSAAIGSPPLTYQWRLNGTNLPGQTLGSLSIFGAQARDAGHYSVMIANSAGAVTSQVAILTVVVSPPTITVDPLSISVNSSSNAAFSIGAAGSTPLASQWRLYGTNIPGATELFYRIPSVMPYHAGPYTAVVSNSGGSVTSKVAILTINYIVPLINRQPTNLIVQAGSNVVLYSGASGSPPMTYQWQKNGTHYGSSGGAALGLNNAAPADSGSYRLIASNPSGSATSQVATLTVLSMIQPGPAWQWVRSGGGQFGDFGEGVAADAAGNIYISGTTAGPFNLLGLMLTNAAGPFVMKLDSSGNGLWVRRASNGSGQTANTQVATDGANVYLVGAFTANNTPLYFNNVAITGNASGVTFVAKYDANGNQQWAKRVGTAQAPRVAVDGSGGIYLAGIFSGSLVLGASTLTNASQDMYVTRLDGNGNYLWAKNSRGVAFANVPQSVKVDAEGNVWISGYFSTRFDLGGPPLLTNSLGGAPGFVARLQPNGTVLWQKGTTNLNSILFAQLDIVGGTNAIVAGTAYQVPVQWGSNSLAGSLWAGRITGAGQMHGGASGTNYSTTSAFNMAVDRWGNTYLATIHGANALATFGNHALPAHQETGRLLLARLNADDTWEWARTDGSGHASFSSLGRAITVDATDSPIVVGLYSGTNRVFGSTRLTNTGTGANAGSTEVWVGKLQSTSASMPVIRSVIAGGSLRLSWSSGAGNYILETAPSLNVPFGPFAYTATTNTGTGAVEVNLPVADTNAFFILRRL